jgi:hypothetical protein
MTATAATTHRVTRAVAGARDSLSAVAEVPLWSMDATETVAAIEGVLALEAQLAELKARLLTHADAVDVPGQTGATSTANWLAHHTKTTRPAAHRTVRLAAGLESRPATQTALAEGRVHVEQAQVILRALDDLPDDLDPDLVVKAEAHLLELARHHDAKDLKMLGRRLLEVIDPDAADAHEAQLLEREERDAQAASRLVTWEDGHGKVHGRFTLPTYEGAALKKALLAIAAPKHQAATTGPLGERKPGPERMGRAFGELITRYPAKKLPKAGGLNATVVALIPLETLLGGLKAAQLDTGEKISASLARKIACEAGIIPAVLDGQSQVLDLGRKKRFHSQAQRIAATLNQRGTCIVEGCDASAGHAHMHHPVAWSAGGGTDRDGMLICPPHHARIHDPRYRYTQTPGGRIAFTRRT